MISHDEGAHLQDFEVYKPASLQDWENFLKEFDGYFNDGAPRFREFLDKSVAMSKNSIKEWKSYYTTLHKNAVPRIIDSEIAYLRNAPGKSKLENCLFSNEIPKLSSSSNTNSCSALTSYSTTESCSTNSCSTMERPVFDPNEDYEDEIIGSSYEDLVGEAPYEPTLYPLPTSKSSVRIRGPIRKTIWYAPVGGYYPVGIQIIPRYYKEKLEFFPERYQLCNLPHVNSEYKHLLTGKNETRPPIGYVKSMKFVNPKEEEARKKNKRLQKQLAQTNLEIQVKPKSKLSYIDQMIWGDFKPFSEEEPVPSKIKPSKKAKSRNVDSLSKEQYHMELYKQKLSKVKHILKGETRIDARIHFVKADGDCIPATFGLHRLQFIAAVVQAYNSDDLDEELKGWIEDAIRDARARDISDWARIFSSSGYWWKELHLRILSRICNVIIFQYAHSPHDQALVPISDVDEVFMIDETIGANAKLMHILWRSLLEGANEMIHVDRILIGDEQFEENTLHLPIQSSWRNVPTTLTALERDWLEELMRRPYLLLSAHVPVRILALLLTATLSIWIETL